MTGGADDEVLRDFESIYLSSKKLIKRKEGVSRLIQERATLTEALRSLEDIYRPFKMSTKRVKHPLEILTLNQYLPQIEVISIDYNSSKIGLSLI